VDVKHRQEAHGPHRSPESYWLIFCTETHAKLSFIEIGLLVPEKKIFFNVNTEIYGFPYCGPFRPPGTMVCTNWNLHYIRKLSCKYELFWLSGSGEEDFQMTPPHFCNFVIISRLKHRYIEILFSLLWSLSVHAFLQSHTFSQFARKCVGRPHTFLHIERKSAIARKCGLILGIISPNCEKVFGRPHAFLQIARKCGKSPIFFHKHFICLRKWSISLSNRKS
jgi:hypothetical protein